MKNFSRFDMQFFKQKKKRWRIAKFWLHCIAAAVAITIIVILIFNSPETRNLKLNTMYLIVNAWFHKKLICNMPKTYLPSKQKSFFMLKYKAQCVKDPWCSKGLKIQIEIGTIEGLYWKTYTPIIGQANPLEFL